MGRAQRAGMLGCAVVALAAFVFDSAVLAGDDTPRSTAELLARVEATWRSRDLEGYLSLWAPGPAAHQERLLVSESFTGEQCTLQLGRTTSERADAATMTQHARAFCIREPSGILQQSRYLLRSSAPGWQIEARAAVGQVERFVHLALDPAGYRADGLTLRLEDIELRMERGTLFLPPASIGPTALVFVGTGTVRFTPRPAAEQEQLRQFCGRRELIARVKTASVRLNPNDLERLLGTATLETASASAAHWGTARRTFERDGADAYRLDANLPGSPWWSFPPSGKAVLTFQALGRTLVYGVAAQPESLSLLDRTRGRHICMYPDSRSSTSYHEDDANSIDVLHHSLRVRLDPERVGFEAEDELRLRARSGSANLYLRLAGDLTVRSVTSPRWGSQLFFRSARQNLLVIALSEDVSRDEELTLNVSYAGTLAPTHGDTEAPDTVPGDVQAEREVGARMPKVYSNEPLWYPQALYTDYATSRLVVDVPEEYEAVSGGERVSTRLVGKRRLVEYRQDTPCRYLGMAVGRLSEAGQVVQPGITLSGFGMFSTRGELPELLQRSASILQYYQTLFGPCPYPRINVVFGEGLTPGGYSPPGMTILSRRALRLRRLTGDDPADFSDVPDFFLAHELAHQWWGHGVAPANYRERWLSEALAHYAAALWVQHTQGERAFRQVLDRMIGYARSESDQGPISLGQRLGVVRGDTRILRAVIYDKGALVLHMLRGVLGDNQFFEGLRRFQEGHRFRTVTTDDLGQAWAATSGQDLGPYLDLWVSDTPLPRLRWSQQTVPSGQSWRTTVKVTVENLPGSVPLEIAAESPNAVERTRVLLTPAGGVYTLETRERPRRVRLNDDRGLLARFKTERQ
jgi:hypothetical protein